MKRHPYPVRCSKTLLPTVGIVLAGMVCALLTAASPARAHETGTRHHPNVIVSGKPLASQTGVKAPHYHNGHVYVSVKMLARTAGVSYRWDGTTLRLNGHVNDDEGYPKGIHEHGGFVYAPLRLLTAYLNHKKLLWIPSSQSVYLEKIQPKVTVNGQPLPLPAGAKKPHFHDGSVYVSVKGFAAATLVDYNWDGRTLTINGQTVDPSNYEKPIHEHHGFVYGPARLLASQLGISQKVRWEIDLGSGG